MSAYYNEIDPEKAEWIRELIKASVIAPGDVDERSIADVSADDLRGYTQCHFFAGIGVWSYALRLAGWPDDRPVWTGSCPCPSFSAAGKGLGFADPRHLWPEWYRLIRESRPGTVFGEQVNAAIGHGWLDLVCGDMEAAGYAIAAAVLGAHSAGAPHIRQRLYFCADTADARCYDAGQYGRGLPLLPARSEQCGGTGERADSGRARCQENGQESLYGGRDYTGKDLCATGSGSTGDNENAEFFGRGTGSASTSRQESGTTLAEYASEPSSGDHSLGAGLEGYLGDAREWRGHGWLDPLTARSVAQAGATRGFWGDCDWWYGRDGKYRPIGPGLFPLATGAAARVLRLRGYGDAICAETAQVFIESYLEAWCLAG